MVSVPDTAARGAAAAVHTPALYDAVVSHDRDERIRRGFHHPVHYWLVDLDDLPRYPWFLRPFVRFRARDHLGDPRASIRANVDAYLAGHGVDLRGGRVVMLANAAALGYTFNPLSVFWAYDGPTGELACIVAEVHNTYNERHCYLLRPDEAGRASVDKEFYVSPFLPMEGHYLMRFSDPGPHLSVTIALRRHGATTLSARLRGTRVRAGTPAVLGRVLRRPLAGQRVATLIRAHGIVLWLRRVPIVPRPRHTPEKGVR